MGYMCAAGNPGMATGGMGDVLTGIIAGILAQGLTLKDAAEAGVDLHAKAADSSFARSWRSRTYILVMSLNELRLLIKI